MGAAMDNVETYFIFRSAQEKKQSFENLAREDDTAGYFPFISLNEIYVFSKESNSYPYSAVNMMEGFLSQLSADAYWGQYFMQSEELEMDDIYNKTDLPKGLQLIEPHNSYENIKDFAACFATAPGWKKFTGTRGSFHMQVLNRVIDGKNVFWFENTNQSQYFPWVLEEVLLHVTGNKIYSIMDFTGMERKVPNDFGSRAYIMEIFANTADEFKGMSYNPSEESGWRTTKFLAYEPTVVLNGQTFTDCVSLEHDYMHVNCFVKRAEDRYAPENYLCHDRVFYSWWQKDKGLVAVGLSLNGKEREVFTATDTTAAEAEQAKAEGVKKEIPVAPAAKPKEKKGFWQKLFGK